MASNSNIDIEDATQHLRDILKLDRAGSSQKKSSSFNGELNGLLGADVLNVGEREVLEPELLQNSENMNTQEKQIICLTGDDSSTSISILGKDVEIVASPDSSISNKASKGSNKVKINPVAKYEWEHKYYYGNLIAVSNSYLAYPIRGANGFAVVRVLNVSISERTLLKGFTGGVTDLAFAHLSSNHLACLDEAGNLFVWQLTEENGKILDDIIVHIKRPEGTPLNSNRRVIWCPFIPEENEDNIEDGCQTLALLHEDRAEVWDLDILRCNNSSWPVEVTELKEGFIIVKGHTRISEGALSPDGTVLATASHDGYVKFWQIYIEGHDLPRCLHEWKPHNGRPLSCLIFCDNHKKQDPEIPFWRFLVTGADQNQELKMWCTVSWTCLQTINFSPEPFSSVLPSLKVSLDLSAEYLILSDVQRKVLYVMELLQDQEKGRASFVSISEFLLTHPVLSFGIQDVSRSRQRHTEVLSAEEESESGTCEGTQGSTESKSGIQIKLFSKPKLMTPDAFMTPSASLDSQFTNFPKPLLNENMCLSCRPGDELTLSPKMSLDSSVTLSSSSSSCLQASPRNSSVLITGHSETLPTKNIQVPSSANPPLLLDLQSIEPLLGPQASPTRERSPDVISSASTAMSQDIPEIASETLLRGNSSGEVLEPGLHSDSMASAASALHLLPPRNRHNSEHSHHSLEMAPVETERLTTTPSLLEAVLSQENVTAAENSSSQPWPAAPDITRETRNSIAESSREDVKEKHKTSPFHRHPYHLHQHDSQDASAEQSDHDDEVASLACSSGNYGSKSTHRLPVKEWKVSPRGSPKLKKKSKKDDGAVGYFILQVNPEVQEELLSLVRTQQREIAELKQSQLDLMQRLTNHMDSIQGSILGHVEHMMVTQQEQEQRRIERILADGHERNRQMQEHLSQHLSQTLSNTLSNRLDKAVREELKKTVSQSVSKCLEPVTGQLSNTIAAKLTAVEGTLKENVAKLVKAKNTTDAIGRSVADTLQGTIQTSYKEAFQSVVLPVFEKGCQSMFQQINESFKQGTAEYIQQLETHLKNKKLRENEARDPLYGQLQQMIDTLQSTTDQLASSVTATVRSEVQHQLHMVIGNLQDSILTQVQRIVKGEVSLAMKEQQAAVTSSIMQAMRSAAGTPIPSSHLDYQTQQASILQLLQQGQLNQAFQQALSASDLNLVLYVCETVNSQQVFGQTPCPLIQPVLLSLIQQLSTNLATRTELKISYLEDAVMNLDHSDPVTRDHMSTVLSQVRQKLFQFLQSDPHNPLGKKARRLMIMLQGLVNHGMS
uniref:Enhancer of mRNA-decapping protein 4 n=1 Tax=Erpetoichthys calabaricus TaxID=27687 RepID=A0A8C4S5Z3_ERPCA